MYLWKHWRETRFIFIVSLMAIALLFVLVASEVAFQGGPPPNLLASVFAMLLPVQIFPTAFIAWLLGSYGVGRDLGEKSGSYLFTRPASRASFVWRDWGYGAAQLFIIVALLNIVIGFQVYRIMVSSGDALHGSLLLANGPIKLVFLAAIESVGAFLVAALVFGVTYFSTVIVKHSRGVMLAAGSLLGYVILQAIVKHYWPNVELPHLIPDVFQAGPEGVTFTNHLGLWLAIRAAVVLLFPFAAQMVLEKTDI
jgi:ABC-type transport system involved in multi-copper enzyme maturation permease subunit